MKWGAPFGSRTFPFRLVVLLVWAVPGLSHKVFCHQCKYYCVLFTIVILSTE